VFPEYRKTRHLLNHRPVKTWFDEPDHELEAFRGGFQYNILALGGSLLPDPPEFFEPAGGFADVSLGEQAPLTLVPVADDRGQNYRTRRSPSHFAGGGPVDGGQQLNSVGGCEPGN
jgi:hypothetical protein